MRTKMANMADMPKEKKLDVGDDYEVKGHLSDLMRAHEIMSDPDKMSKVHELAGRHSKAITSIQDLKDLTNEKFGSRAFKKMGERARK